MDMQVSYVTHSFKRYVGYPTCLLRKEISWDKKNPAIVLPEFQWDRNPW
jgi:hypothetical protein